MLVVIGGDLVPTNNNIELFEKNLENELDINFKKEWYNADYRIFNLECVLGKKEKLKPILKAGPNLIADENAIEGIKSLNPNLVLLSNNHILDYGQEGLENTMNLLSKNNILCTGIINNNHEKEKIVYFEKDKIKVGFYNLCENEFTIATSKNRGANPFINAKNYKEIYEAKKNCDYLIVIFHGGKEFYRYPSPNLQQICHDIVDFGADVVILQHSHCIGCEETYNSKKIVYGQGNFIFYGGNDEYWNSELLIKLNIKEENIDVEYIPLEKKNNLIGISSRGDILKQFYERSEKIKQKGFIEDCYREFAEKNLNSYLSILNKNRFLKKVVNRIFKRKYFEKKYKMKDYLSILNIIECEAHRELLICGLKNKINELESNKKQKNKY